MYNKRQKARQTSKPAGLVYKTGPAFICPGKEPYNGGILYE